MNTILVFDVETTGLLPRLKKGEKEQITDNLPYIIQLSFILYDIRNNRIIKSYNAYVRPKINVLIPEKIVQLTGITNEMLDNDGEDIVDVLVELYEAYSECDAVIAHNLEFDSRMVNIETERNYTRLDYELAPYIQWMFDELYCKLTYVKLQCTMQMSVNLCNIQKTN
jgi:DNA polymerase III epsilon subunit-like protein